MFISNPNLLLKSKLLNISIKRRLIHQKEDLFSNGSVLFSKSKDIFVNLSLEDWIYRNIDLNNKKILLLWTNRPSIVIGRHQNPWRECHLKRCIDNNVEIARRNSGGGTVYHDLNNLNISFLSSKKLYNRKSNLIIIRDMLLKKFDIESQITKREDLVLKSTGDKISGTASKLGSKNSYHHCTLLIDCDLFHMRQYIRKQSSFIESKATQSIPSNTKNLISINGKIELQDVVNELSLEFAKVQNGNFKGITEITPEETYFSGIKEIENTFRSWKWIYGKTPRFTLNKTFKTQELNICVTFEIFHGVIEKFTLTCSDSDISLFNLNGIQFTRDCLQNKINETLVLLRDNNFYHKLLSECIMNCAEEAL